MISRLARVGFAIAMLTTAACGSTEPGDTAAPHARSSAAQSVAKAPTMTIIEFVSGSRRWTAEIDDGPAARDFLAQLPLTLALQDFGGNEKIADLPRALARDAAPDAMTPRAGDVAFYAPWGNLAIFYRNGQHSSGLIRLGRLQGEPADFGSAGSRNVTIRTTERRN